LARGNDAGNLSRRTPAPR